MDLAISRKEGSGRRGDEGMGPLKRRGSGTGSGAGGEAVGLGRETEEERVCYKNILQSLGSFSLS